MVEDLTDLLNITKDLLHVAHFCLLDRRDVLIHYIISKHARGLCVCCNAMVYETSCLYHFQEINSG